MSWVDETEIKNILKSDKDFDDDMVAALIAYVEQTFKTETGYSVDSAEITEKIVVVDADTIALHHKPVTAVASFTVVSAGYSVTINSSDYRVYKSGIIKLNYKISGEANITYTAGHSTIPPDILKGCTFQVIDWINKKDRLGLRSKSQGGSGVRYADLPFLPSFERLIKSYKNPVPDRSVV